MFIDTNNTVSTPKFFELFFAEDKTYAGQIFAYQFKRCATINHHRPPRPSSIGCLLFVPLPCFPVQTITRGCERALPTFVASFYGLLGGCGVTIHPSSIQSVKCHVIEMERVPSKAFHSKFIGIESLLW